MWLRKWRHASRGQVAMNYEIIVVHVSVVTGTTLQCELGGVRHEKKISIECQSVVQQIFKQISERFKTHFHV